MKHYLQNLLLVVMLASPILSVGQFGYIGGGAGFRSTILNKGEAFTNENTTHNVTSVNIGGMYRPYRFLGVGVSVSIPVLQFSTFSFQDARTSNGDSFFGFGGYGTSEHLKRNIPKKFEYSFDQSNVITILGRLYLIPQVGVYFDLRYSMMSFSESFVFERPYRPAEYNESGSVRYATVPKENINYFAESKLKIPGVGMGIQHHMKRHLYLNFNFNIDFMNIKNEGFSYNISYDYDYWNQDVIDVLLTDQTNGTHLSFSIQAGAGYIF